MTELVDYGGEFDPHFNHAKLAKETLVKLLKTYSEYMLRIDGFWYLTVMDKWGNNEAFDCDVRVWEKAQLFELETMTRALNIHGNDVATVMKYLQVNPWIWIFDYEIDMRSSDHSIVTFHRCPTLLALEREGMGREERICQELEAKLWTIMAHYFNPNIRVSGIKVPPRTGYKDVCCQWEYKLDHKRENGDST